MPAEPPLKLFLGGLSVTMGNPKVMVFYLALLPSIIDMQALDGLGYAELVVVTAPRAGCGFRRLRASRRPRPATVHQRQRHPDGQQDVRAWSWPAPPRRSRPADAAECPDAG